MVQLKAKDIDIKESSIEFQFLYGTIKRFRLVMSDKILQHFNSSMVQLKEIHTLTSTGLMTISIPLWYN